MKDLINETIKPENDLELAIIADKSFIAGTAYGKARKGHPEGQVINHIKEVLDNIDKYYINDEERSELRIIAIVHDSFKHQVDRDQPKTGENHHGMIARRFAQKYINNYGLCKVIELHDEAYNAWSIGNKKGDWNKAEIRANKLANTLKDHKILDLYLKFYRCDNYTGDKSNEDYEWFIDLNL